MRILYISQYFPPEFGAAAARAHSMSRWLTCFGHDVTVITAVPNYLMEHIPESHKGKRWGHEKLDGTTVYRAWLYTSKKRNNWRRMANYLSFMASSWWHGRKLTGPYDIVIASSPPLFVGLTGVALARHFHAPLVFDVRDMWPDTAVKFGAFKEGSLIERMWRAIANFIYEHATAILPVTNNMYQAMIDRGISPEKLHLIPNGVDLDRVQSHASDLRDELNLKEKFVVLYAGLIGVMQGVNIIITAASLLQHRPDIHFLIVGDGVQRDEVATRLQTQKLRSVTLMPRQPREKIPRFLNTADLCLATLANEGVKDAVPLKMLEAWAYHRPVITMEGSEAGKLVNQCQGGMTVPFGDPQALADAILTLATERDKIERLGAGGRKCVEQVFDRRIQARRMEQLFHEIIAHPR